MKVRDLYGTGQLNREFEGEKASAHLSLRDGAKHHRVVGGTATPEIYR
jgi:hypothetical protein